MEKGLPNSPDRAIFLADAHLNQEDIHSRNFLALADRAAEETDEWRFCSSAFRPRGVVARIGAS